MKLKSCHTALLTAVLFTLWLPVNASVQEERASFDAEIPTLETVKQDQETPSGLETGLENPETRVSNKNSTTPAVQEPTVSRDSELKNTKPPVKTVEKSPKEDEKIEKEEDDPLSFNFLYYIIEKFKASDIVE